MVFARAESHGLLGFARIRTKLRPCQGQDLSAKPSGHSPKVTTMADAGVPPNAVNFAPFGRRTGVPPVREDSASRLSANETTGWMPILQLN